MMACPQKCNPCKCDAAKSAGSKQEAAKLLADRRALYVNRGRRMLLLDLLANGTATADDVSDVVPLPQGVDPHCLSGVPGVLVRRNIIRSVGRVPSVRPGRHGGQIQVWAIADRPAAEKWLRDHPDWPDPLEESKVAAGSQSVLFSLTQKMVTPAAGTVGAA